MTFIIREEHCSECRGSGVRMGEIKCFDCSGEGSWNASCADCGSELPLNEYGLCESCDAIALTECLSDPLAGWGEAA